MHNTVYWAPLSRTFTNGCGVYILYCVYLPTIQMKKQSPLTCRGGAAAVRYTLEVAPDRALFFVFTPPGSKKNLSSLGFAE